MLWIFLDLVVTWISFGLLTLLLDWINNWSRILGDGKDVKRYLLKEFQKDPDIDPRVGFVIGAVAASIILGPFAVFMDNKDFK